MGVAVWLSDRVDVLRYALYLLKRDVFSESEKIRDKMCHPANYNKKFEMRRARRVVRKYRRLSYRKQMLRLRSLLDCEDKVEEAEVLERTVSLIEDLEARLLQRLRGASLRGSEVQSVEDIREVVGNMMAANAQ